MQSIKVYTSHPCSYCSAAKQLLTSKGYAFEEIDLRGNHSLMLEIMRKSGQRTVPQIFVGEHSVGGFRELSAAVVSGELEKLVHGQAAAG